MNRENEVLSEAVAQLRERIEKYERLDENKKLEHLLEMQDRVLDFTEKATNRINLYLGLASVIFTVLSILFAFQFFNYEGKLKDFKETMDENNTKLLTTIQQSQEALSQNQEMQQQTEKKLNYIRYLIMATGEDRFSQRIELLSQAISVEQEDYYLYLLRAQSYYNESNIDKALTDCITALELNPDSYDCIYLRGKIYEKMGENELALQDFDTLIKKKIYILDSSLYSASIYLNMNENEKAFKTFDKAIAKYPNSAWAFNCRGYGYYRIGNYEKAIVDFSEAIKLNPKYAAVYHNRSLAYEKINEVEKASADKQKFQELSGGVF